MTESPVPSNNSSSRRSWKRTGLLALKLAIMAAAFGYLVASGRLKWEYLRVPPGCYRYLCAAACMLVGLHLVSFYRFKLMLRGAGVDMKFGDAVRVSYIGLFFSVQLIGMLGGDMVKLAYVIRETGRRSAPLASVVMDRLLGLFGLLAVAGITVAVNWSVILSISGMHTLVMAVSGLSAGIGLCCFLSLVAVNKGRKPAFLLWLGLTVVTAVLATLALRGQETALQGNGATGAGTLLSQLIMVAAAVLAAALLSLVLLPVCLPGGSLVRALQRFGTPGEKVVQFLQAGLVYKDQIPILLQGFLLSVLVQIMAIGAIFLCAQAVPLEQSPGLSHIFLSAPPAFIASSVPLLGKAIGVSEAVFDQMLRLCTVAGKPLAGGAAIYLLGRLVRMLITLAGGAICFFLPRKSKSHCPA